MVIQDIFIGRRTQDEHKMNHVSTAIPSKDLPGFIDHILRPNLPHSLPLFRRCQYETTHPTHETGAEVWFVTATDKAASDTQPRSMLVSDLKLDQPWLAAYINLRNSGQTQVWVFASWEAAFTSLKFEDPIAAMQDSAQAPVYQHLFFTLFRHLRTNHIPRLSHDPPAQWQRIKDEGKIVSLPFRRSKCLFGTLAECHWPFFDEYSSESGRAVSRTDKGYLKYVLTSTESSLLPTDPPLHLHFAPMEDKHLQIILDRSIIPRTIETLREIHVVGLFNDDATCVAWGMLSKDGSIGSLHTEPDYRRKGLAEAVCRRILSDQTSFFAEDAVTANAPIYSHADVSANNLPSRKTMEKLGCKVMWRVAWIEVDLGEPKDPFPTI